MSATASPTGSGFKVLKTIAGDERVDTVLAEVPGHDVPRVVKVLKPETRVDAEQFVEACRTVAGLDSSAVLPVLAYGRMRDGRAYVVTSDPEVEPFSRAHALAMDGVVASFSHAARALAALHAAGLTLGGRVTGDELYLGPPTRLDCSLAGLALDGTEPARDVKALIQVLISFSVVMANKGQFEASVLHVLEPITDATELATALEELLGRWRARTEVSGKYPAQVLEVEPDLSGASLGQWQLDRVLGEGAMGRVYLGRHTRIGREAAVKVLKSEHARNAESVQRFIQEATAVNAIKNEHIVEISDFGEQPAPSGPPVVFCVMELLEGRSLADAMDHEPFTLVRAARVAREMALALSAAHQVGVVHRDIKPENIFLSKKSSTGEFVKVLDFGVAKLLKPIGDIPRSGTQAGIVIGTPDYMAPEQALGGVFDFRVDIWAVGIVLYEMLTGRRPFSGETFGQLVVELTTKAAPPLPNETRRGEPIPAGFSRLVMKCLARRPEDRYQSGEALAQALEPWTRPGGPQDIEAADEPLSDSASDLPLIAPRSKAPLILGATFVLGLLAAGAYVLFGSPPPEAPVAPVAAVLTPEAPKPVEAPKPAEVKPAPPPLPTTVWLEVATNPSGATVKQVDGEKVLGKTPLKVELPKRQTLALKLELDGHVPVVREVPLSANVALQIDLEKKPKARASPSQPPPDSPRVADPKKGPVSTDGTVDPFAQ